MQAGLATALCLLFGLGASSAVAAPPAGRTVLVFAAASTSAALDEIKQAFHKQFGIEVRTSYAGTSTLAQQVVNGAEADVFLSASAPWADFLQKQGLVHQRRSLLANRLVVIVPADAKISLRRPDDLLADAVQHLAMADPDAVPAGVYAKRALKKLGLWERLKPKVAAADDVQHALTYVETGAAEAGLVYSTDAAASQKVKVAMTVDTTLTGPIEYPLLLLRHGGSNPAAVQFFRHLGSPGARHVFERHGFVVRDKQDQ